MSLLTGISTTPAKQPIIAKNRTEYIHSRIANALNCLRDGNVEKSRQLYLEILKFYQKRTIHEKKRNREYVIKLYHLINYAYALRRNPAKITEEKKA